MKPDGQNLVIQKWMLPESLVSRPLVKGNEDSGNEIGSPPISYPESSGSLVSGLVARRDSGEMEFFQFF